MTNRDIINQKISECSNSFIASLYIICDPKCGTFSFALDNAPSFSAYEDALDWGVNWLNKEI